MTATVFVDTNVLIYALDPGDSKKQAAARAWRAQLWATRRGRLSMQVVNEFYSKAIHRWPNSIEIARAEVLDLFAWQPLALQHGLVELAWKFQDRFQLSFWDSLIVAAAKVAGCRYLLTEDLQDSQNLDGVHVLNPFHADPTNILG